VGHLPPRQIYNGSDSLYASHHAISPCQEDEDQHPILLDHSLANSCADGKILPIALDDAVARGKEESDK
jgi:hypothetical protein